MAGAVLVLGFFFKSFIVVEGCGHVGEGAGGGQRVLALSTGRAGARQRIVHMSTAWGAWAGPLGWVLGSVRESRRMDCARGCRVGDAGRLAGFQLTQ